MWCLATSGKNLSKGMPWGFQKPASQKGSVASMMGNGMSEGSMASQSHEARAMRTAVANHPARQTQVLMDMSPKSFCSYSPMSFWIGMWSLSSINRGLLSRHP